MIIQELKSVSHLNQLLKNYRVVIVDIYTNWCGPCKVLAPKMEQLADDFANDTVIFVKENSEENQIHQCEGFPTIVFYVDNKKYHTILGLGFSEIVSTLNNIFLKLELIPKIIERNINMSNIIHPEKITLNKNNETSKLAYSDGYTRFSDMAETQSKMPQMYLPQGSSVRQTSKRG